VRTRLDIRSQANESAIARSEIEPRRSETALDERSLGPSAQTRGPERAPGPTRQSGGPPPEGFSQADRLGSNAKHTREDRARNFRGFASNIVRRIASSPDIAASARSPYTPLHAQIVVSPRIVINVARIFNAKKMESPRILSPVPLLARLIIMSNDLIEAAI